MLLRLTHPIAVLLAIAPFPPAPAAAPRCTVVPWTEGAAPTVAVRIDGKGPFTFVVDTGAEMQGWIRPEVAAALGLKVAGKVPPDGPDDPEQDLRLYAARTIQVGGLTVDNPRLGEMLQLGPKPQAFDGIIGSDLFAAMQIAFDYRNRQLRVGDAPLKDGSVVPFDRGMPVPTLDVGGQKVAAHLDTGNIAGALFVAEAAAGSLKLSGPAVVRGKAMTHYGTQTVMEAPLADPVRYGDTVLPVTTVRWPPAIGLPNLGSKGLAGMLVRIDPRSRRLAIMPAGAPLTCG